MTEDAFLVAKIEREKRHKEREKDKKHHKSHKSSSSKHKDHKSDRKDRDRHRDRKDRDKEKRSSNDDKKKSSSPKDSNFPAKNIEKEEPEVRPEDIEKKVEEILASSGALEVAKSREIAQQQQKQKQIQNDNEIEILQVRKMSYCNFQFHGKNIFFFVKWKIIIFFSRENAQIQNNDNEIEILQDDVNEPGDIDIPAFTQAQKNEPGSPDPEVLKESEVTSTVTIKTPEETLIGSSTNPSVWNGEIGKPEI